MLIVVYSVVLAALGGSGALLCRLLRRSGGPRLFTSLAAGLSLLHLLILTGLPVAVVLAALLVMALAEGLLRLRATPAMAAAAARDARWLALIVASALPLWAYMMFRPLWAFDARNFWLFPGRITFMEGRFPVDAFHRLICHFGPDYRLFMNADYPKLVGALGASVATLFGYWNEYLPKLAMLVLHTVWLVGLFELGWRWRAVAVNLLLTGVARYRYFFDSASLDIHVAALTLIAILALVRAREDASEERGPAFIDLAVAALAVGSQLKYEGRALTVIVLVGAVFVRATGWRELRRAAPMGLLFLPTALWLAEVRIFAVPSYLQHSRGVAAALERLHTDFVNHILPGVAGETLTVTGLIALVVGIVAAKVANPSLSASALARAPGARLGIVTALGYSAALCGVYLVTPYKTPLEQMSTSIGRATLPIEASLIAAAIAIFEHARRAARPIESLAVRS